MDFRRIREDSWMIAVVTLAACATFLLGGPARAIFVALSVGSVWLFLRTVIGGFFRYSPSMGIFRLTIFPNGCGGFLYPASVPLPAFHYFRSATA
jgi:hypothetical protein